MARIIILGSGGRLGAALMREYQKDHEVTGFNHAQLDLGEPDQLRQTLGALPFDLLINCAALTNVDRCESEPELAFQLNADAPGTLAEVCAAQGAKLIHVSTDYVFSGDTSEPYTEEDEATPISIYGESKLEGERRVLAVVEEHLVVRVSWVFGPDRPSFVDWVVGQARETKQVAAVADKVSTPTYTSDIASMLRPLFARGIGGLLHLGNRGQGSWQEYGQWALDCCRAEGMMLRTETVDALALADMKQFVARRPVYTALSTAKYERLTGQSPRAWRDAVREYVRDHVAPRHEV